MSLRVPEAVRERALSQPAAGEAWLDALPAIVADLSQRWELTTGDAFGGGTASVVVAARDADGHERVIKVVMPEMMGDSQAFARSVRTHEIAAGRGCVGLTAWSDAPQAMLLERLGPNLHDVGRSVDDVIDTIAATLPTFWRPVADDVELPTGADQAAWLARYITEQWDALGRPCEIAVVDRAVAYCDERIAAFDPTTAVLVHGDAHGWNTLHATGGTFKFVDPEGLRSHREHDLAVPMREYNEPLIAGATARLVRERAEHLARRCDADPDAVWQWGYIERVSTGLANLRAFSDGSGAMFLEVARRCL